MEIRVDRRDPIKKALWQLNLPEGFIKVILHNRTGGSIDNLIAAYKSITNSLPKSKTTVKLKTVTRCLSIALRTCSRTRGLDGLCVKRRNKIPQTIEQFSTR